MKFIAINCINQRPILIMYSENRIIFNSIDHERDAERERVREREFISFLGLVQVRDLIRLRVVYMYTDWDSSCTRWLYERL